MKPLLALAAARPLVALALGYVPLLLLMAALVILQSGWKKAAVVMSVNTALVLLPLGCVWLVGRGLRRSPMAWWKLRLAAIGGGVPLLGALVFVGIALLHVLDPGPVLPMIYFDAPEPPPLWHAWLAAGAVVAGLQLPPLLLGLGVEVVARRFTPARPAP